MNATPKVIAPHVEPRKPGETGWDYRKRQRAAWARNAAFNAFMSRLAAEVKAHVTGFVRDGNALPGIQEDEATSYRFVTVQIQSEDGGWREVQARQEVTSSAKSSYVELAAHLSRALTTKT